MSAAPQLYVRFAMHINRGRHGHVTSYHVLDGAGVIIGHKAVLTKDERVVRIVYSIGDNEYCDRDDFLRAYEQKRRDDEWDAADPARKVSA